MISLLRSRNMSNPSFKVTDSQIPNFNPSSPINQSIKFYSPGARFIDMRSIPTSVNASFETQNLEDIHYQEEKSSFISHHPPKSKLPRRNIVSISNLYSPVETLPSLRDNKPPLISSFSIRKLKNLSQDCTVSYPLDEHQQNNTSCHTHKASNRSGRKLVELAPSPKQKDQEQFSRYLDYLKFGSRSLRKEQFEQKLKAKSPPYRLSKYFEESDMNTKPPSTIPTGPSLNLGTKDSHSVLGQLSINHQSSRKTSIFLTRRKLNFSFQNRDGSPDLSQDSIAEVKGNATPNVSPSKKSYMAPGQRSSNGMMNSGKKQQKRSADVDNLFASLAVNLRDLFALLGNDQKMVSVLEKLAQNPRVLNLIVPKFHRVNDYDAVKLEHKFAMIEVVTETLSIPAKLQKIKEGITLIEPSLIDEMFVVNKKIEEFTILKKKEQLKVMEEQIVQTFKKLEEFEQKTTADVRRNGNRRPRFEIKSVLEKTVNINSGFTLDEDPLIAIEKYQRANGKFKNVSKKNIEHAKGVNELFSRWMKGYKHA